MFCTTCGKKIPDDAMFCGYCGMSVGMKLREAADAAQSGGIQPAPQSMQQGTQYVPQPQPQQGTRPVPQPAQSEEIRPVSQPTQAQQTQYVSQSQQPQGIQYVPQPQQQGTQSVLQSPQQQGTQYVPQPQQQQGVQPAPQPVQYQQQAPQYQYVPYSANPPVRSPAAPKKKMGWIWAIIILGLLLVIVGGYILYVVLSAYFRIVIHQILEMDDTQGNGYKWSELPRDPDEGDGRWDQPDGEENDGYFDWEDDVYAYGGYGIGYVGDIMHTYWFDFTVNDVLMCDSYQGYTAKEGYQLIVLDLALENTFYEEVPMFDTDFWVEWGEDDSDFGYAYPVTDLYDQGMDFLPEKYELPLDKTLSGLLMFEVPVGYWEYMLIFEEYFDSDGYDVGDWFGVYIYSDDIGNVYSL